MAQISGENTTAQLSGVFKRVFAPTLIDLIPDVAKLARMIKFESNQEIGENYNQPVALQLEHGFTFAAPGAGAYNLNAAIAQQTKNAQVDAYSVTLRTAIDYETLAKASAKGDKAFERALSFIVKQMVKSVWKNEELQLWYGASVLGLGVILSNGGGGVMTLTAASWAAGIWSGLEGAPFDAYTTNLGAQVNTNAALIVSAVDYDNKTVTFTGNASDLAAMAATNVLVRRGAVNNEMNGIDLIVTNTGNLYGISAATYALWKGNTYDVGNTSLTLQKVQTGVAKGVVKGLEEAATLWVSPATWANLCADQAALRRYGAEMDELENGAKKLTMFSQNGQLDIVPHIVIKEGEAWLLPQKRIKKVGSTDVTFNTPGRTDEFFFQLPSQAGVELRAFYQLNTFIETPGYCVKFKNIVNVS